MCVSVCVCVCVCVCVLFIYTTSVSIICVLQEEPSLVASNQQIWLLQVNNFLKEMTLWKANFWYQWIINSMFQCNKDSCCEHIGGVSIYLYGCVSLLARECSVCLCRGWSRPDLTVATAFGCEKTGAQKDIFLWKTNLYLLQKDPHLHQS